jgi:hypothetical protein
MNKPEDILKVWLKAVNNGDTASLLSLYNKNAVLIPTFSNIILNSQTKIREYFKKLTTRKDLSVSLHKKTVNVQKIAENIFSLTGIYCWRFAVDDEPLSFEARFSYVLNLNLTSPIIHHHSSQIPRIL